jgi:hypothetical protein
LAVSTKLKQKAAVSTIVQLGEQKTAADLPGIVLPSFSADSCTKKLLQGELYVCYITPVRHEERTTPRPEEAVYGGHQAVVARCLGVSLFAEEPLYSQELLGVRFRQGPSELRAVWVSRQAEICNLRAGRIGARDTEGNREWPRIAGSNERGRPPLREGAQAGEAIETTKVIEVAGVAEIWQL